MNKKPFIIGGIILAAVVVVCVALAIVSKVPSSKKDFIEAQRKFDQYASYLLYGEVKDELSGEYNPYHAYELDDQLSAEEVSATYWDTAQNLLDAAVNTYIDGTANEDTLVFLQTYQQNFSFLRAYRKSGDLSEDLVIAKYISSGIGPTKNYVDDFYGNLAESGTNPATEFAEQRIAQYQAFSDILEYYKVKGCLIDGTFNDVCISGLVIDSELMSLWTMMRERKQAADGLLQTTVQNLESNCWVISAQLRNGVINND